MKRFQTVLGKTLIFLCCAFLLTIACASAFAAYIMNEAEVYTRSEDAFFENLAAFHKSNAIRNNLRRLDGSVDYWADDYGNLLLEITDQEGKILLPAKEEPASAWAEEYWAKHEEDHFTEYFRQSTAEDADFIIKTAFKPGFPDSDIFQFIHLFSSLAYDMRYSVYGIIVLSVLGGIFLYVLLVSVSGRRKDQEGLFPGPFHRIPFDLLLLGAGSCLVVFYYFLREFLTESLFGVLLVLGSLFLVVSLFLGLSMSASVRIKDHSLIRNTLCMRLLECLAIIVKAVVKFFGKLFHGFITLIRAVPVLWKTILVLIAVLLVRLFCMAGPHYLLAMEIVAESAITIPVILYLALMMKRLQEGGRMLAAGDLAHQVDTKHMVLDLKEHGENLNHIAMGMSLAVEERLKSERMKTELITNVSHDIKTPLTSIINYANLIGEKTKDDEETAEYSKVLLRQSERLKRLIEDLIEASKASTGNLDVTLSPCDASVFLSQVSGEYEEKLSQAGLTLVVSEPKEEIAIMADGRRMWRIFDNLMNNICKYAQPSTRVYLSLEKQGDKAVFIFRNTSKDALNITEEELMERFTRGDASRSSDGNGLGLSIARSLAELQGGELRLQIDGDLFKAILSFPVL